MGTTPTISDDVSLLEPLPTEPASPEDRERARREAKKRRRRGRIAVGVALLVVLLIGGAVVGLGYRVGHDKPAYYTPKHVATVNDGIVAGGNGPVRVDVYTSYPCTACAAMETTLGPALDRLVATDRITLVYHPLAIGAVAGSTGFPIRAAASMGCASDLGSFPAYSRRMLAVPAGTSLTDDQIVQVGARAGMINPAFAECLRGNRYNTWVTKQNGLASGKGIKGTPTVLAGGTPIAPTGSVPTWAELKAALAKAKPSH